MAFTTITDLSADETISLGGFNKKTRKENPTSVEGYYLGKRSDPPTTIYHAQYPKLFRRGAGRTHSLSMGIVALVGRPLKD